MSGHVFHPGHDNLHGNTVVIYGKGGRSLVGRWDAESNGQIALFGVALHEDGAGGKSTAEWVSEIKTYGVPVQHPRASFPRADVLSVVLLRDA